MPEYKKRLLSKMRSAVDTYRMIEDGDSVAVGVSGGKDSLTLLCLLGELRRFYPKRFSLTALTVDPCFDGPASDYSRVQALCGELCIPYIIEKKPIGEILKTRDDEKPCSLCARLRRGSLHNMAVEQGCNKLALGHHEDDAAETFLMNLLRGARASCFSPVSHMERKGIYLIRPLIFIPENEIAEFASDAGLPVVKSVCPVDGATERARIKALISELGETYGPVASKLSAALKKDRISGWGV